jgi:hypothetical protein
VAVSDDGISDEAIALAPDSDSNEKNSDCVSEAGGPLSLAPESESDEDTTGMG